MRNLCATNEEVLRGGDHGRIRRCRGYRRRSGGECLGGLRTCTLETSNPASFFGLTLNYHSKQLRISRPIRLIFLGRAYAGR